MKYLAKLGLIFALSVALGCNGVEEKDPGNRDSGAPETDAGDDGVNNSDASNSSPDADVAPTQGSYDIDIEEVNIGDQVDNFTDTDVAAGANFGATIAEGRLEIVVNQGDLRMTVGIDTAEGNALPGSKRTDSNFSDATWVSLDIGNEFWDMQGGGSVDFEQCPQLVGDTASVTLTAVRLASSISSSIKEVSGTVTVQVIESDESVVCAQ